MNSPTVSQILLAVKNTLQRPVNRAPEIYRALKTNPPKGGPASFFAGTATDGDQDDCPS